MTGTTYVDAIKQSKGESYEDTFTSASIYMMGLLQSDRARPLDMPISYEVEKIKKMGQNYGELSAANKPANSIKYSGIYINSMPIFAMNGKSTHTVANDTHTITQFTTTEKRKPRYDCVEQIGSQKPHIVYGTLFNSLDLDFVSGNPLGFMLGGQGLKPDVLTVTLETPTYPSSKSKPYNIFTHAKWGTDGSEVAFANPVSFNLKQSHDVTPLPGDDGYDIHINEWSESGIDSVLSLGLKKEEGDLVDSIFAGETKSLLVKISNADGNYIEIDSANSIASGIVPVKKNGDIIGWNVVYGLQNPTFICKDGTADSFTTIPT